MTNQYNHPSQSLKLQYGANRQQNSSNKFQCNRNYSPLCEPYSTLRKGGVNRTTPYHYAEKEVTQIDPSPLLGKGYSGLNSDIKNHLPTAKDNRYDGVLSKLESGQPYRYPLAFFVFDICLASQAGRIDHTALLQGNTIISKVSNSPNRYDGLTSQNTTAFMVNMRGGFFRAKSKTHRPISLLTNSVTLTQKSKGGYHA